MATVDELVSIGHTRQAAEAMVKTHAHIIVARYSTWQDAADALKGAMMIGHLVTVAMHVDPSSNTWNRVVVTFTMLQRD